MIHDDPDAALLARLQSREPSIRRTAAGELFARTQPALFQLALRLSGRRDLAEEALQETYVRVLQAVRRFRGEAKLSTWIYRIALRESLRIANRYKRAPAALADDLICQRPGHAVDLAEADAAAKLLALIAQLPEAQRVAFSLTAVDGLTRAEASTILAIPIGTVDSRLAAARESLRSRLTELP